MAQPYKKHGHAVGHENKELHGIASFIFFLPPPNSQAPGIPQTDKPILRVQTQQPDGLQGVLHWGRQHSTLLPSQSPQIPTKTRFRLKRENTPLVVPCIENQLLSGVHGRPELLLGAHRATPLAGRRAVPGAAWRVDDSGN